MEDVTVEELEARIRQAAGSGSVTLPSSQLRPLLSLAMRKTLRDSATISRLQRAARGVEVKLTGEEIRMILDYALHAKLAEKRPLPGLRVLPQSPKKD
jgi:hypothetical protein